MIFEVRIGPETSLFLTKSHRIKSNALSLRTAIRRPVGLIATSTGVDLSSTSLSAIGGGILATRNGVSLRVARSTHRKQAHVIIRGTLVGVSFAYFRLQLLGHHDHL